MPRPATLIAATVVVVAACGRTPSREEPTPPVPPPSPVPTERTITLIPGLEYVGWDDTDLTLADYRFRRDHDWAIRGGPTTGSIVVPSGVLVEARVIAPTPAIVAWANAGGVILALNCRQPVPPELEHLHCNLGDHGNDVTLDDDALGAIAALPALRSLDLRDHPAISFRGLAHLTAATHLRRLDLGRAQLSASLPTDLDVLATLPALTELGLASARLGKADLAVLGRMPRLEALDVIDLGYDDDRFAVLADLHALRALRIGGLATGDGVLAHVRGLTQLERLDVTGDVTDAGLAHLSALTHLERVDSIGTQVTDAGCAALNKTLGRDVCVR